MLCKSFIVVLQAPKGEKLIYKLPSYVAVSRHDPIFLEVGFQDCDLLLSVSFTARLENVRWDSGFQRIDQNFGSKVVGEVPLDGQQNFVPSVHAETHFL